jgi:hypothetical protein
MPGFISLTIFWIRRSPRLASRAGAVFYLAGRQYRNPAFCVVLFSEPSTCALLALSALGVGGYFLRRRQK